MQDYVNITKASEITGKHKDTIRRLIRQNPKNPNIMKGNKGEYLISRVWLENIYSLNEPHTAPVTAENNPDEQSPNLEMNNAMSAVVEALTAQLQAKDTQIEQLQKIIIDKEANTTKLQDQFQQLLASRQLAETTITKPTKASEPETADVVTVKPTENTEITVNKKSKKPKKKASKQKPVAKNSKVTASNKQPKKRWWKR
jgi:hypothetical protein